MSWLADAKAREAAAKLIVDQKTRVALWCLAKDARPRNRLWAGLVSDWLSDCELREPPDRHSGTVGEVL